MTTAATEAAARADQAEPEARGLDGTMSTAAETALRAAAGPDAIERADHAEREARELEGLIDIDPREDVRLIQDIAQFHSLKSQIKALEKQAEDIKVSMLKELANRNAQGLVLDGFVFARRSEVPTTSVDIAKLKALAPKTYAKVLRTTMSVRFTAPRKQG